MYCENCGTKISEEDQFCTNCGTPKRQTVTTAKVVKDISMNEVDKKNANLLCIISLVLTFASDLIAGFLTVIFPPLGTLVTSIAPICNLAGLVLMIVARVKYPESKFAKILMWIYIVLFVGTIILIAVVIITCVAACNSIDTSGCS